MVRAQDTTNAKITITLKTDGTVNTVKFESLIKDSINTDLKNRANSQLSGADVTSIAAALTTVIDKCKSDFATKNNIA